MEIITISIFLGFALVLFALSKMVKDFLFVFISGITFVLVGLSIFTTGLDIKSGESENIIYQYGNNFSGYHWDYDTGTAPDGPQLDAYLFHTDTTTTNTYSTQDPITTHGMGAIIIWLGLYIILVSWDMYKKEKEESFLGDKPEV